MEEYDSAIVHFTHALGMEGVDTAAYLYQIAACRASGGDTASAINAFGEVERLADGANWLLTTLSYEYAELGRYHLAIAYADKAIAADSLHPYAYNNRGFARLKLGDPKAAIPDFDKSIALKSDFYHWCTRNRGNALVALGQLNEAIEDFNRSVGYNPKYHPAYNDRGEAWEKLGQRDKAIADYREALRLKPGYKPALDNLKRLKVEP